MCVYVRMPVIISPVVFVPPFRMEAEQWFIVRQEEAENLRRKEVIGEL